MRALARLRAQGHRCPACTFCAYTPLCVLMRRVRLLKPSNGVTAVLQLCPGCEKPSMIGKIYSSVLCSGSGADLNLPLSFFFFFPQRGVVESVVTPVGARKSGDALGEEVGGCIAGVGRSIALLANLKPAAGREMLH